MRCLRRDIDALSNAVLQAITPPKIFYEMKNMIFILSSIFIFIACKTDCEMLAQVDKKSECLIVVDELLNSEITKLNAKGRSLKDGKECFCKEDNRWWYMYRDQIERGDTIIKRKGELTFNIHKKDTILTYEWECEGQVYK